MSDKPIYVVQPSLPPFEEFVEQARKIWDSKMLTNGGPLHQELEAKLCDFLGVPYISLFNNATIGLMSALKVLELKGEVITTPFSFIATSHAILWAGLEPVFVDIDPDTLNIDPVKIEAAITPQTSAIMAVHCYGTPCDHAAIQKIADKHNLKVIYDSAHAFGVEDKQGSILNYGDLSVLSFHATKVFNTFEGGAIISHSAEMKEKIDQFKNFGIVDETHIEQTGLNGKMSEINAALGLVQIAHYRDYKEKRAQVASFYRKSFSDIEGIECLPKNVCNVQNYAYFPVWVEKVFPLSRDDLYEYLKAQNIYARRYFYPLLNEMPMYRGSQKLRERELSIASQKADKILCLPIYSDMGKEEQSRVVQALMDASQIV